MKKIKIEKKLSLTKETIAKLNNEELNVVKGGGTQTSCFYTCNGCQQATQVCPSYDC